MPPNPSRICSEAISCPGSPAALPSIRKQANKQPSGPGLQQCFPVRSVEPYGAHRAVLFTGSASAACIFVHICPISLHADRAHRAQRDTYAAPRTQISVDLCRHHFSLHRPGKGRFSRCAHTSASHAHPSSARASASHTLASASDSASSSTAPTSHTPSSASPHTHAFLSLFPCRTASDGYPPGQMSSAASHRPRGSFAVSQSLFPAVWSSSTRLRILPRVCSRYSACPLNASSSCSLPTGGAVGAVYGRSLPHEGGQAPDPGTPVA